MFETDRLTLSPWRLDDAEAAFRIYGDEEVMRFLGAGPPMDVLEMRERLDTVLARYADLDDGTGFFAARRKSDGEIVGSIILQHLPGHDDIEVGWHLARVAWGHGYATEGARRIMEYGFDDLALARIVAVVDPGNERSKRVCLRLGMNPSGKIMAYERDLDFFVAERQAAV